MKLPFTWEELTPADKAWLAEVPVTAVWDFVATLPTDERIPFDAVSYAPSGADFMREYGDQLREYLAQHPNGADPDPDWLEGFNELAESGVSAEASKAHAEKMDQIQQELFKTGDWEAYYKAQEKELDDFIKENKAEIENFKDRLREFREQNQINQRQGFDPLVITGKRKATKQATSSQGGTDRKLTEARQRIAELEAEVAKLTEERDAALKARDEMLKLYTERGK